MLPLAPLATLLPAARQPQFLVQPWQILRLGKLLEQHCLERLGCLLVVALHLTQHPPLMRFLLTN